MQFFIVSVGNPLLLCTLKTPTSQGGLSVALTPALLILISEGLSVLSLSGFDLLFLF